MAELLIMKRDNHHPDPWKDKHHCYKRGDVVVVMEDGHKWGKEEGPPTFFIVKLKGIPADDVMEYIQSELSDSGTLLMKRRYGLSISQLPVKAIEAILNNANAPIVIKWQELDRALKTKDMEAVVNSIVSTGG